MNKYCPLPDHPEFSVLECSGYREYRVENRKSAGSRRRTNTWISSLLAPSFLAFLLRATPQRWSYAATLFYLLYLVRSKVFRILYESVIILPPHGIQLETHRGISEKWSLSATRRFIPTTALSGVVINEGLRGWNVLYYLVAVKYNPATGSSLEVAYQDLLPCHSILLQVFEGVHEILLSGPVGNLDVHNASTS